ncbi:MAG: PA14 domain-containing protein [Anaerolineae bacterium]
MMRSKFLIPLLLLVIVVVFSAQPTEAQSATWHGEYFNNPYLISPSEFKRDDAVLAFNWGTASPDSRMNADNFSVRWGADPYFAAGTYRFWVLADDYVRLNVGFAYRPQINSVDDTQHIPGQLLHADVTLSEGVHHIQVDYQEFSGNAFIYVSWANVATNPTTPNFVVSQPIYTGVATGPWTAQYFANPSMVGNPSLIQSEGSPTHYWGSGSPGSAIPADNFSARWYSTPYLDGSNYQLAVKADDGVRVYVDGALMVNEWHAAGGVTYTVNLNLNAGQHSLIVDYYEAGGEAYLDYSLNRMMVFPSVPVATVPAGQGGGTISSATWATVQAWRLNVRSSPSIAADNILLKVSRNEVYPVVGKNGDGSWCQIAINNTTGWVSTRFVNIGGNTNIPVTASAPPPVTWTDTGFDATALTNVNIRNLPSTRGSSILALLNRGANAHVIGRSADSAWWQINYQGVTGWVSARYAVLQSNAVLSRIPVTG